MTAQAVTVFADLDAEIRRKSNSRYAIDDLTRALMRMNHISVAELRGATDKLIGMPQSLANL